MKLCKRAAVLFALLSGGVASGQDVTIASLPFLGGQTAGPNGTDYEPPNDARDLWVIEDFVISSDVALGRFETVGTVFPAPVQVFDVTARVYDALPTVGNLVLSSIPGHGHVEPVGFDWRFYTDFGGQYLAAGSYYIVWNASTATNLNRIAILWAQGGPHAVGGGGPSNAWLWNPGGGWGFPGNIKVVPQDLQGTGQTGVNFALYGGAACYANCDASTAAPRLNVNDFQCFINSFAQGLAYANCDASTAVPVLNVNDFQCFLNRFAAGCG